MKDKFGNKKEGQNISTLKDAQYYFEKKSYNIIRYYFDTKPNEINKKDLVDNDDKMCEVCGKSLLKMSEDTKHGLTDQIKVRLKKHFVFIDSAGGTHYTCYCLNTCIKHHTDYDLREGQSVVSEYEVPDAESFFSSYINLSKIDSSFRKSLVRHYDNYVKPFLNKWVFKNINKTNVLDFIYDLSSLDEKFTKLFIETERDYKFFRSKIFRIIGVEYGQNE